jgi:hypothetical protein
MTDEFAAGLGGPVTVSATVAEIAPGEYTTVLHSPWRSEFCEFCGHTFRSGDRVRVDDTRAVRHLDPLLGCAVQAAEEQAGADVGEFVAGLEESWPVRGKLPVRRTEDEPHLLMPPLGGLRRHTCLWCADTFRPGELVIVCPCQAGKERKCRRAVHRDPIQGLVCWESWSPASKLDICPVMLMKLKD